MTNSISEGKEKAGMKMTDRIENSLSGLSTLDRKKIKALPSGFISGVWKLSGKSYMRQSLPQLEICGFWQNHVETKELQHGWPNETILEAAAHQPIYAEMHSRLNHMTSLYL